LAHALNSLIMGVVSEEVAMTVQPGFDDRVYLPVLPEQGGVVDLVAVLRERGRDVAARRPRLVLGDGREVDLPESIMDVLVQVAEAMRAGLAVAVTPQHLSLSTQEAADLLGISRMTLVRLLEAGGIPFDRPGRHRRLRMVDVLEYRQRQRHRAEEALADMVADTERLGLYASDPDAVQAALTEARAQRRKG
jgi:excisionase family DNA binding protein